MEPRGSQAGPWRPAKAGLVLVVQPAFMTALSPFAGRLSDRVESRVVASLGMGLTAAGLRVDDSEAGLYLWATAEEDGRTTIDRLAARGILASAELWDPRGRDGQRLE